MIFSLFGKKPRKDGDSRVDRKASGQDSDKRGGALKEDSIFETRNPLSSTVAAAARQSDLMAETRRKQAEMTAKIDAIESEMAGEFPTITHGSSPRKATPVPKGVDLPADVRREPQQPARQQQAPSTDSPPTLPPLDMSTDIMLGATASMSAVELSERSPGLSPGAEESAIFYANGQTKECERALREAIAQSPDGRDAWLLLFELYQQGAKFREFEALAVEYSMKFLTSPPAWREHGPVVKVASARGEAPVLPIVGLPPVLDAMAVKEIDDAKHQLRQYSRVRVGLDAITSADEVGVKLLLDLLRSVRGNTLEITLLGVEQAAHALRSSFVVGGPHEQDAVWLLVLELYRLLEWEKQYEDLAVEYSVTFEVSPPQYEPPPANLVVASALPKINMPIEDEHVLEHVNVPSFTGEITGRGGEAIALLDRAAGASDRIEVDCSHLSRVDFSAAGALLNWLLAAQNQGKQFAFHEVNVLVAALFGVMGIDGVARVERRKA